jgi:hypothetical protein
MKLEITLFLLLNVTSLQFLAAQLPETKITKEEYIEMYRVIAIEEMNMYKIPASITLAQGILESGNGNSILAKEANNHFGIKCHKEWTGPTFHMDDDQEKECFRKYENPNESFRDHSLFLTTRPRYAPLFELDLMDYEGWARGLKSAGYATNPQYAEILIKNIKEFELFQYDQLYNKPLAFHSKDSHKKESSNKKGKNNADDFDEITLGPGQRKVMVNNGVRFVFAKSGDSFKKIADDFDMAEWQICNFNDSKKSDPVDEGQMIYIGAKKNKAGEPFHTVQPGETMHSISQKYGIKLKKLCKYNTLSRDATLYPDQKLKLR